MHHPRLCLSHFDDVKMRKLYLCITVVLIMLVMLVVVYIFMGNYITSSSKLVQLPLNVSIDHNVSYYLYCDDDHAKLSNCLCYVPLKDNLSSTSGGMIALSTGDTRPVDTDGRCAMTVGENGGRMGNLMGQYATLYALARLNNRPAFMSSSMAKKLRRYFKVTMPAMSAQLYSHIAWSPHWIHDWMEDSYGQLKGQFIQLIGYPNSFTFYNHLADEIKREFTLHDDIRHRAQSVLRELIGNRSSATFVGVHVRRGDYVMITKYVYKGVMADRNFFVQATDYFRSRYPDAIFVVVSSSMAWCKENIANDRGDVYFVGNSNESDPISDFAILINCNHTIFTIGTYGYWAAYLTGGEVVYLTNYTLSDSLLLKIIQYDTGFLPQWIPIAADLNQL